VSAVAELTVMNKTTKTANTNAHASDAPVGNVRSNSERPIEDFAFDICTSFGTIASVITAPSQRTLPISISALFGPSLKM